MNLAMTPDQFSTAVMAWLGALAIVGTGVGVFLVKMAPIIEQIKTLFRLHDVNSAKLDSQQTQISNVALATPSAGEVQDVKVVNKDNEKVPVKE